MTSNIMIRNSRIARAVGVLFIIRSVPSIQTVEFERVDIMLPKNKEWYDKYKYDIPVFHMDGEFLMKHRVDLERFKQKLSEAQKT
ncbi:hypothetical protein LSH36_184g02064 [Paralvinella palmiformis]|uniref:Glutaredoxin-like protein n=1 Tax=Paralvinella palmiformis TaxID=53620 RepID=A0AAD9JRD1_9ANNE|nr:hypothetical protein LSH36_184g02064 [Paralvinella palmiformis]